MADSPTFEWTSAALEKATSLSRLEARGTVRLALRAAGLDVGSATREQMLVLLRRVLPRELAARGISDGEEICLNLARELARDPIEEGTREEAPEDVFRRLGNG